MFNKIQNFWFKNSDKIFLIFGKLAIISLISYLISLFIISIINLNGFRFDPLAAIFLGVISYMLNLNLSNQKKLIESQIEISKQLLDLIVTKNNSTNNKTSKTNK